MSVKKKYTAAIIGCGDIGFGFDAGRDRDMPGALTHFKALNSSEKFTITAAADKNTSVLEKINISCR